MRPFILFVAIIFNTGILSAQHNPPGNPAASSLNSIQWLQDIDFLQKAILRLHPDPFYKNKDLDREKFDKLI